MQVTSRKAQAQSQSARRALVLVLFKRRALLAVSSRLRHLERIVFKWSKANGNGSLGWSKKCRKVTLPVHVADLALRTLCRHAYADDALSHRKVKR